MQPWNFIVIHDRATKARVHALFLQENEAAAANYEGPRAALYRTRGGAHVLGRNTIIDTDLFSTCCAIENLWLAARVEGIGVGWVSILDNDELRAILGIPKPVVPVAYLCIGYAQ